jgi:hypothetical protein
VLTTKPHIKGQHQHHQPAESEMEDPSKDTYLPYSFHYIVSSGILQNVQESTFRYCHQLPAPHDVLFRRSVQPTNRFHDASTISFLPPFPVLDPSGRLWVVSAAVWRDQAILALQQSGTRRAAE